MANLSVKPNKAYPSVPSVSEDTSTHTNALQQLKEAVETHERRNNNYLKSFIRFEELVTLGIVDSRGVSLLTDLINEEVEKTPSISWGDISGTLNSQTDLQSALDDLEAFAFFAR